MNKTGSVAGKQNGHVHDDKVPGSHPSPELQVPLLVVDRNPAPNVSEIARLGDRLGVDSDEDRDSDGGQGFESGATENPSSNV